MATSDTISGEPTPINVKEIGQEIKDSIDYMIDYRQQDESKPNPSSLIEVGEGGLIQVIRE